jgi:hypothetical protein
MYRRSTSAAGHARSIVLTVPPSVRTMSFVSSSLAAFERWFRSWLCWLGVHENFECLQSARLEHPVFYVALVPGPRVLIIA